MRTIRGVALGRPTAAFAVAVTDARECKDALKARRFTIEYDEQASVLDVKCRLAPVR